MKITLKRNGKVVVDGTYVGRWLPPETAGNPICRRADWLFTPFLSEPWEKRKYFRERSRQRLVETIEYFLKVQDDRG